ncbi:hypothetical protein JCM17039_20780 [Blautia glucerasea]
MDKVKQIIKRIFDFLGETVPTITFTLIFITFIAQVVARYFFGKSITWSNEISVLAYMWTMFFGVGKAMEADAHVVFGLVYDAVGQKTRYLFRMAYNSLLIFCLVLAFVPCLDKWMGQKMITGVLKLPYKLVFAPFLYMMIEMVARSIIEMVKVHKLYKEGAL